MKNEEYKKAQEERKENAKDASSQGQYKLEQDAIKENQKQEAIKEEEEQKTQEEENNQQNNQSGNTQLAYRAAPSSGKEYPGPASPAYCPP